MNKRNLTLLGGFLVLVGVLPFLLMGLGMTLSLTGGCEEILNGGADDNCPHNNTPTGGWIANLMFAGIYVPVTVPLGLIGVIVLWITRKRQP